MTEATAPVDEAPTAGSAATTAPSGAEGLGLEGAETKREGGRWGGEDWGHSCVRENLAWDEFYRNVGVFTDEEWEAAAAAFRRPLPASFRLANVAPLRRSLKAKYEPSAHTEEAETGGRKTAFASPLEWYREGNAYCYGDLHRHMIRRNEEHKALKQMLVEDECAGSLVRQEVVSMIPPLAMAVKRDIRCFDLCAAPGSKTTQLMDLIASASPSTGPQTSDPQAAHPLAFSLDAFSLDNLGFVVANDVNVKRAHLLSHQVSKQSFPGSAVVSLDASALPRASSPGALFSRVLADVPCSGDGTLRKNLDIWKDWTVHGALSLFVKQQQILLRGLESLEPGGILVYSTCSLNPIEDEAVVASALQHYRTLSATLPATLPAEPAVLGESSMPAMPTMPAVSLDIGVELLDFKDHMELGSNRNNLFYKPGSSTWRVPNPFYFDNIVKGKKEVSPEVSVPKFFESHREFEEYLAVMKQRESEQKETQMENCGEKQKGKGKGKKGGVDWIKRLSWVNKQMFAESYDSVVRETLSKCARIPPNMNDSGGFFVAVFRATERHQPVLKRARTSPSGDTQEAAAKANAGSRRDTKMDDELFDVQRHILKESDPDFVDVVSFYGLSTKPELQPPATLPLENLVVDSQKKDVSLTLTSPPEQEGDVTENLLSDREEIPVMKTPLRASFLSTPPRDLSETCGVVPLVRRNETARKLYLVAPSLIDFASKMPSLRYKALGAVAFEKLPATSAHAAAVCAFRPHTGVLPYLLPFMSRRRIVCSRLAMAEILEDKVSVYRLLQLEAAGHIHGLDSCRALPALPEGSEERVPLLQPGGLAAVLEDERVGDLVAAVLMTATGNLTPLINKLTRQSHLRHINLQSNVSTD